MQLAITPQNFTTLLQRFTTSELEQMVMDFPYFAQAHVLLAKKYQQESHPAFDAQLQLAALHSSDREMLHELFNSKEGTIAKDDGERNTEPRVEVSTSVVEEIKVAVPIVEDVTDTAPLGTFEMEEVVVPKQEAPEEIEEVIVATSVETTPEQREEEIAEQEQATSIREEVEEQAVVVSPAQEEEREEIFDEQEPHSFGEWLNHFSPVNKQSVFSQRPSPLVEASIENKTETELDEELNRLIAANVPLEMVHERVESEAHYSKGLDNFIEQQKKRKHHSPFVAIEDELEESIVTETLAKILATQGKIARAIRAYEILSLKNPRKKNSFAARIFELKNQL